MTIYSDVSLCNPKFAASVTRLHKYLIDAHETGRTKTRFEIFETFRTPMRQRELIAKGVSKAGPFQSAHQFGLAVDFVPFLSPNEARELAERTGERVFPGWNWHSPTIIAFLRPVRSASRWPYRSCGTRVMWSILAGTRSEKHSDDTSNRKGGASPLFHIVTSPMTCCHSRRR